MDNDDTRDLFYGRGHREGRELGRQEGWAERDAQVQDELRKLRAENVALHAALNAAWQNNPLTALPTPSTDPQIALMTVFLREWEPDDEQIN